MQNLISIKNHLILASSSRVRKKILQDVGIDFEVISPFYDEDSEKKKLQLAPRAMALYLAKQKALSVSEKFPNSYVIGSDQLCEFEGKEFSKSKNAKEAIEQLSKFSGKEHVQNNAVVVAFAGKIVFQNFSRVKMKMRKISNQEIESYVAFDKPWGCAGSYKYESLGKHLFEKVSGDYYSVLGMAIQPLLAFFYQQKIIKINFK